MPIKGQNPIAALLEVRKAEALRHARDRQAEGEVEGHKYVINLRRGTQYGVIWSGFKDVWLLEAWDKNPRSFGNRMITYKSEIYSLRDYELASNTFDAMVTIYGLTVAK